MPSHTITVAVSASHKLVYQDDAGSDAKKKHVAKNDKIKWTSDDGHIFGAFKGASPLEDAIFAAEKGDTTKGLDVDGDPDTYPYLMILVLDDGTVLSQDPDIIVDL